VWCGASIGSGAPCETLLLSTRPNAGRSWRRKPELVEILVAAVSDGPPIGTGVALFLMVTFGGTYAVWCWEHWRFDKAVATAKIGR